MQVLLVVTMLLAVLLQSSSTASIRANLETRVAKYDKKNAKTKYFKKVIDRDINEGDVNEQLGYKKAEEIFEHVTEGKSRDIKIGIRLWKKRKGKLYIPYEISYEFPLKQRQKIKKLIRKLNSYLVCNKGKNVWIKRNKKKHTKYVKFVPGKGCSSHVGKSRWNVQYIRLAFACIDYSDGIVPHEMMHAMGFYHEMQRGDRDKYVKIIEKNIPYDFKSVMMYPLDAFSKNGKKTMIPKIPLLSGFSVGQRSGLSSIDIKQVNGLYECGNYKPVIPSSKKSKLTGRDSDNEGNDDYGDFIQLN